MSNKDPNIFRHLRNLICAAAHWNKINSIRSCFFPLIVYLSFYYHCGAHDGWRNGSTEASSPLHTHQLGTVQVEAMQSYSTSADPLHIWPNKAIFSKAKQSVRFHVHSIFYPHVDFQLCQTVCDGSLMLLPTYQQPIFRHLSRIGIRASKPAQSGTRNQYFQYLLRENGGWENAHEAIIKAYTNEQTQVWHLNVHLVKYN